MDNIVWLDSDHALELAKRLEWAAVNGRSIRFSAGRDARGPYIKYDMGNTGWTPPIHSVE